MDKQAIVFLHLGSNIGDRSDNLHQARALITAQVGEIISTSSLYETAAWGITDQADFINQALKVRTRLLPSDVLLTILDIEMQIGRKRIKKWAARLIDIDILLYENQIIETEHLCIPHKHLSERNFVLIPLMEIGGEWIHPVLNQSIEDLYWSSKDTLEVRQQI